MNPFLNAEPLEIYQIEKGMEYFKNFNHYISDKSTEDFRKFFNTKQYRISEKIISYRLINYWEKIGLINIEREKENEWRKYSLMDLVWLVIVSRLRQFGYSPENIKKAKETIAIQCEECQYGELEFYTALAYLQQTPTYILFFSNYRAEVGNIYEILDSTESKGMLDHISISLNSILQGIFPEKELKPIYRNFIQISDEQNEILETIKKEKVEEIKLSVRNGKAIKMNFTISEPNESNIGQLKNKNAFQSINIEQDKGKTKSVKRIVSVKF